jgi:hypothetical protein
VASADVRGSLKEEAKASFFISGAAAAFKPARHKTPRTFFTSPTPA